MSFCGTLEHNRGMKFLTLALHCIVLQKPLMDLVDAQYVREGKRKKPLRKPHATLGAPAEEADGQLKMFPITTEQRQEFLDFADSIEHFLEENEHKKEPHDEAYWAKYNRMEFSGYEFYGFWRHWADDELKAGIALLRKVGNGEPLDDNMALINFLGQVNAWALFRHEDSRGGCF